MLDDVEYYMVRIEVLEYQNDHVIERRLHAESPEQAVARAASQLGPGTKFGEVTVKRA